MDLPAIALSGLDQAQRRFEQAAAHFTGVTGAAPDAAPVDIVDLSTAMVSLLSARNDVEANIKMVKTADDMQRQILDLLA